MQKSAIQKYGAYAAFPFFVLFLTVLSAALLLAGVLLPIGMVLHELGLLNSIFLTLGLPADINIFVVSLKLPAYLNIPIAIVAGIAFFYCGIKLYQLLRTYLSFIDSVKNN